VFQLAVRALEDESVMHIAWPDGPLNSQEFTFKLFFFPRFCSIFLLQPCSLYFEEKMYG